MAQNNFLTRTNAHDLEKDSKVTAQADGHRLQQSNLNLLSVELSSGWQYTKDFSNGTKDAVLKPFSGARDAMLGRTAQASTDNSTSEKNTAVSTIAYKAGSMIGQAIDFGIAQTVAHKIPILKSLGAKGSAMSAGFAMGFLTGSEHINAPTSFKERLENGLEGAATIGIMEGGGSLLAKAGIADSLRGRILKSTVSGAVAGVFSTQVESKLTTGHFASLSDSAVAAASWGLTGAAFSSAPALIKLTYGKPSETSISGLKAERESVIAPEIALSPRQEVQSLIEPIDLSINRSSASLQMRRAPANPINLSELGAVQVRETNPNEIINFGTHTDMTPDQSLKELIDSAHPSLTPELKVHLQEAAEKIAKQSAKARTGHEVKAEDIIGHGFDAQTFERIYSLTHASSARYVVLGTSTESWLAEPAIKIAHLFGKDWKVWFDAQEDFKAKKFANELPDVQHDVGRVSAKARDLPLLFNRRDISGIAESQSEDLSRNIKQFLIENPSQNSKNLKQLSEALDKQPASAQWLMKQEAQLIRGALRVWQDLPLLPAPLAVEFAGKTFTEQLTANAAWQRFNLTLSTEAKTHFETNAVVKDSADYKSFHKTFADIESHGTPSLLQEAQLTPAVVSQIHPALDANGAAEIAGLANQFGKYGIANQRTPYEVITGGFSPELYMEAKNALSNKQTRILTMDSMWNEREKAFQLVNTFGCDWKLFLDGHLQGADKNLLSRDQFFSQLHLPVKTSQELKPLRDFLLNNVHSDSPLSTPELGALLNRIKDSPSESFDHLMSASKEDLLQASKAWMIATDLPLPLAAHFGNAKTVETVAAALTYFDQIPQKTGQIAHLDGLSKDAPEFSQFWEHYPQTLERGKHALIAESNSVRAAINSFHPKLSGRHQFALEQAAMKTESPMTFVAADTKAGTFAKVYDRFMETSAESEPTWQQRNALATTNIFGRNALAWLDKQRARGIDYHDATRWLPVYSTTEAAGLGDFLNSHSQRKARELQLIAKRWPEISESDRTLRFPKLVAKLRETTYENVVSPALAREAFEWDVKADHYPEHESRFLKSLDTPSPFPLAKKWSEQGLTGRFLPRTDPRGLYLGEHTNCCQHPGEAGSACAWFGQESARSGFFVVENKAKEIVAQSLAWISDTNGLVFDSLESKGLGQRAETVSKIYQKAANDLSQTFETVTLGKGTERVNLSQWPDAADHTQTLPTSYKNGYTDARAQVLLAKGAEESTTRSVNGVSANGGNHSQLLSLEADNERSPFSITILQSNTRSQMSVKHSNLEADLDAAEVVAQKVYPSEYQYVSDGDSMLYLNAPEKGTVGYASIDLGSHEISDIAVLPEFRPHSRLLLQGVFDFLVAHQNQPGHIWNAELRQSTSDRLLNYYEQKGRLTILSREQTDTMHGEPMYSVRFTIP